MARANGVIGCLTRLRRDARGNALAIMAAAMIPLCAFAGSAIDIGRLYVVRTRLQTACDAGVLAGRKFMDATSQTVGQPLSGNALTQANAFFTNNFGSSWAKSSWFLADTQKFTTGTFADANGMTQVSGNASAQVPMTLMRMFGAPTRTLQVTCQASFDTPDTDVMFVLDTTGSMACLPSDSPTADCGGSTTVTLADGSTDYYDTEKSGSKMQAVRDAVGAFFDTMDANMSKGSYVRYGFVPYSSTVNAGAAVYAVNPSYLASSWTYQTRHPTGDYQLSKVGSTTTSDSKTVCQAISIASSRSTTAYTYPATGKVGSWSSNTCTVTTYNLAPIWTYEPYTWPTSDYVKTVSSGTATDPSKATGSSTWQGCIEEVRPTSGSHSYNDVGDYDIDNLPRDLNPDWIPTTTDDNTKWGPMWQSVEYGRNWSNSSYSYTSTSTKTNVQGDTISSPDPSGYSGSTPLPPSAPNLAGQSMRIQGFVPCGGAVMRLTNINTTKNPADPNSSSLPASKTDITTYLKNLHPHGGTYHDTGMLWGLRMLSPQGIFTDDTKKHNGHAEPKRVIVFLTDGAMAPDPRSYGMYGIEYFDGRISGKGSSISASSLSDYHNARFLAMCNKATEKNIQVWVVAVGQSLTQPLKDCVGTAHPERAIYVNNTTDLSAKFKLIATAISMLRISQ